jgi:hypothetical protein
VIHCFESCPSKRKWLCENLKGLSNVFIHQTGGVSEVVDQWDRLGLGAADVLRVDADADPVEVLTGLGPRIEEVGMVSAGYQTAMDRGRLRAMAIFEMRCVIGEWTGDAVAGGLKVVKVQQRADGYYREFR